MSLRGSVETITTAKRFPPMTSRLPGRLVDKAAPLSTLLAEASGVTGHREKSRSCLLYCRINNKTH